MPPKQLTARALSLAILGLTPLSSPASDLVSFATSDAGVTKSVASWGVDTAWPNYDNVRQSIANIGVNNVDSVRVCFDPGLAVVDNGNGTYSLSAQAKSNIDNQLNLAALAGNKPLTFVPGTLPSTFDSTQWLRSIKATQEYINSKAGFTTTQISSIEVFNEPDYWADEGNASDLNSLIGTLKTYSVFQNTQFPAASTLNSTNAQGWYNGVPYATQGSSHLLGGNLTAYVNFMDAVKANGETFTNPELHSLGEAIVGAEHGMVAGTYWADALRTRGLFAQASDGKRLGYYEDLGRQSAAAVYRAPDGRTYAFAGGLERFGSTTSYRFSVTDRDVYFNGLPVRDYMLHTKFDETNAANPAGDDFQNYGSWSSQGSYADVETGAGLNPLDGFRWKIVNASTGQVLEIANSSTADGGLVRSATDAGGLNQRWNIVRTRNGYFELFNANSGKTMDVLNGSLNNGASVDQWGTADNQIQQWLIENATNGTFYLRNAYALTYLNSSSTNAFQSNLTGSSAQQWRFVLANPNNPAKALYSFNNNANDSIGTNHATTFGVPTYVAGPTGNGTAIHLNGATDYVQLPSGIATSPNITLATYVKWDGGNAWQRIFDFGTSTSNYMFLTPKSGDNTMRFAITTGSGEQMLDTSPLPTGTWVHLALTIGGNTAILYVDGKPRVAGQIILNPDNVAGTLNYLGKSQFNDPLFAGSIDEFRIYDYALDPGQVASFVYQRWTGSLGSSWTTATQASPKNWQRNVAAADYANATTVLFDDYADSFTVSVTDATVTPASVQFDNRNNTYTLSGAGAIAGSCTLTKIGAGTLTIGNANTYSGGTVLTNGTLNINNASALGTGTLTLNGGTLNNTSGSAKTLSANNPQLWAGDFAFGGSAPLNMGAGTITLTANRTLTTNGSAALTVSNITDAGNAFGLTKAGPGNLVLAGISTYTGPTTVTNGILTLAGTLTTSPSTTVAYGSFIVPGTHTLSGDLWDGYGPGGNGTVVVQSGGSITCNTFLVGAGGSPSSLALGDGTLSSGGSITTRNYFVVGHSGAAGSTGSFTVAGGTLTVHTNAAAAGNLEVGTWDAVNALLTISAGSSVNLLNNASLVLGAQGNHTGAATVNQDGGTVAFFSDNGLTPGGAGRLILGSANNPTGTYAYNLNGGTLTVSQISRDATPSATFTFNGGTLKPTADSTSFLQNLSTAYVANGGAILDTNAHTITIAQPLLANGTGGLTKNGPGTLTLTGNNTFTGPTTLNAGTFAFNPTQSASSSLTLNAGKVLLTSSNAALAKPVTIAGSTNSWSGQLNLASNALVVATADSTDKAGKSATLANQLLSAKSANTWTGNGITSSSVAANPATLTLGLFDNADLNLTSYLGQPLSAANLLLAPTQIGDANLDHNVDLADYDLWYKHVGGAANVTSRGDFNLDNNIDLADYDLWYRNVGASFPLVSPSPIAAPVPEPAALALLATALPLFLKRRRH